MSSVLVFALAGFGTSSCGHDDGPLAADQCRLVTTGAVYSAEYVSAEELIDRYSLDSKWPDARKQLNAQERYAVCDVDIRGTRQAVAIDADGGYAELGPIRR